MTRERSAFGAPFNVGVVAGCAFLAGVLVMAAFVVPSGKPPELWEIGPELRHDADEVFADYKAGKVIYTVMLPVLDTRVKARMVRGYRSADFGFVPMDELEPMPTHFWYYQSGEFDLRKYNEEYLFVIIKQRYAHELERRSSASKVSSPRRATDGH